MSGSTIGHAPSLAEKALICFFAFVGAAFVTGGVLALTWLLESTWPVH